MSRKPVERSGLERLWQRDASFSGALLMLPLRVAGGVFRGSVAVRNLWWRRMAARSTVPVVSIGNLTVGGNAKTPFTLFLATRLQSLGLRVAIVSRGYSGAKSDAHAMLVAEGGELLVTPGESGDEPAMMSRHFTGPIAVARRRIHAIEMLAERGPLDVVILDDAFQHTRLKRDVDLVLVNEDRGFGNGRMLPAGPMREPITALARADAMVLVSSGGGRPTAIRSAEMAALARHRVFHARIRPRSLIDSVHGSWHETGPALGGRRVIAVSGLADPASFHAMVREIDGDLVGVIEYPDHHRYSSDDWHRIAEAAREVDAVVTTEKDLIKLERFPFPRDSLYALRLEVSIAHDETQAFDEFVLSRLRVTAGAGSAIAQEVSRDAS